MDEKEEEDSCSCSDLQFSAQNSPASGPGESSDGSKEEEELVPSHLGPVERSQAWLALYVQRQQEKHPKLSHHRVFSALASTLSMLKTTLKTMYGGNKVRMSTAGKVLKYLRRTVPEFSASILDDLLEEYEEFLQRGSRHRLMAR